MGRTRRPESVPSRVQPQITDPEVIDLIEGVRRARYSLDTDLTTAAAALDEDRADVARDILDGSLADVAAFRAAAIERLRSEPAVALTGSRSARSRSPQLRSRRRRALIAIPAVPLVGALAMGAAAAIGALNTAPVHHHARAAASAVSRQIAHPTATPTSATTTLARLERVVSHHPQSSQVIAVANDLHKQLTRIISSSTENSNQLGVVSRLLTVEQRVLRTNNAPGATIALAASRQVRELLQKTSTPVLSLTNPTPPPTHTTPAPSTKSTSTSSKNVRHTTSTSRKHHKRSSHPKHATHTASPTPTPSNPIFGQGLFDTLS